MRATLETLVATKDISVLLVEDEPLSRKLLFHMLREAGYRVEALEDGSMVIEKLKSNEFSVMLLDLKMPLMDGIMLTDQLRTAAPDMLPRTIVMTAFPSLLKEVDQTRIFGALIKPFTPDKLFAAIDECASR